MPYTVYAAANCYGAPIPDEEGRAHTINVLSLSDGWEALTCVQTVEFPEGTLMPVSQQMNAERTRLLSTAGTNGIVVFECDPKDQGKIATAKPPASSAVTPEPLPTPYGVMPVDVTLDSAGTTAYTCNFLAGSISALSVDLESGTLSSPQVCAPADPRATPGIPEKVQKRGPSKAAQALGFPEGFPEDSPHPHGTACDPSGKWLVMGCLGTNHLLVFSLPIGEKFSAGTPDFVLDGEQLISCVPAPSVSQPPMMMSP